MKTQKQLADEMGMSVDTLQNYKILADMIPELDELKSKHFKRLELDKLSDSKVVNHYPRNLYVTEHNEIKPFFALVCA